MRSKPIERGYPSVGVFSHTVRYPKARDARDHFLACTEMLPYEERKLAQTYLATLTDEQVERLYRRNPKADMLGVARLFVRAAERTAAR